MKTMSARKTQAASGIASIPLKEVCVFIRGVGFEKHEARTSPAPQHVPILRAGNIQARLNFASDLIWVPDHRVAPEQRLRPGDIAICLSSGSPSVVGKTAQLLDSFEGSVGAFCGIIRPRDSSTAMYIGHWFRSPAYFQWRDRQARGANIQNLRFSNLEAVSLPWPPALQRERIVAKLNEQMAAVERARAAAEAQLEAAKVLPLSCLRIIFNGAKAKQWPIKPVSQVCAAIDYGYTASADFSIAEPRFLRITDIQDGSVAWDRVPGCRISSIEEASNLLADGDIVFGVFVPASG